MKTTELVVEQVLLGVIVFMIGALPLMPRFDGDLSISWSSAEGLLGAGVLLGLAYLVGVIFDRLADSILETWERHLRLRFALNPLRKWPAPWKDPFPEDTYKVRILIKGGEVAEWIAYLRTRIRLARSLTVFLPGLTVAFQVYLLSLTEGDRWSVDWLGIALLAGYVLLPAIQSIMPRADVDSKSTEDKRSSIWQKGIWSPPRTNEDETTIRHYARLRGLTARDGASPAWILRDVCLGVPFWLFIVLLAISMCVVFYAYDPAHQNLLLLITIGGFGLTMLSGWVWSRILNTYMTYLQQFGRALPSGNKP